MSEEELRKYINAKRKPISCCADLTKYFIGRHEILPVYLTPNFEQEFNSRMCALEELKKENKALKEKNEFLMKRDNKCQMLEQAVKKAIALLTDDNVVADIRRLKPKYNENKYGVEQELLDVLKEVK